MRQEVQDTRKAVKASDATRNHANPRETMSNVLEMEKFGQVAKRGKPVKQVKVVKT